MRPKHLNRFAAIDWSGARGERHRGIAIAVCEAGTDPPVLLASPNRRGWSRAEALEWMLGEQKRPTLIGLDLSPALPFDDTDGYFPQWGASPVNGPALWRLVDDLSNSDRHYAVDGFLAHAEARRHFFVQKPGGDLFVGGRGRLRECERRQKGMQLTPSSCFKLVGASQVGKSSLTGMRVLHRLDGRIPVWPFDAIPESGPLIVEIYTSLAAREAGIPPGRSKMRDADALEAALAKLGVKGSVELDRYDDHATDAIVTAAWMRNAAGRAKLWHPEGLTPKLATTEGWTFGVE